MVSQNTPNTPTPNSAAPASPPAGYDTVVVAMPPQGETTTIAVVPATEYQMEAPDVSFTKDGNNLVAHAPDGGTVVFEDYFTFASSELPPALTLADGAVIPQEQIMAELGNPDLNAAEPAAGPGAGAGATGGVDGGGASFSPYDPGDIGTGLSVLDLLGNLDLAFAPPPPLEDPGLIDFAEGTLSLEVTTTTVVPPVEGGIDGGTYSGIFEDAQPNAHIGNTDVATPVLNVVFTPSDDEVVTQTTLTGFPIGMELTLSDGTVINIVSAGQEVVIPGGLETGIQITAVPPNADTDFDLTAVVEILDSTTGTQTATLTVSGTVVVDAVADVPTLHVISEGTEGEGGVGYVDTSHDNDSHTFTVNEDHAASSDEGAGHYVYTGSVNPGDVAILGSGGTLGGSLADLAAGAFKDDASDEAPTTSVFDIGFTAASNDATDGSEELTQIAVTIAGLETLATSTTEGGALAVDSVLWNGSALYDGKIIQVSATYADGSSSDVQDVRVDVSTTEDGTVELVFTPVISDGAGGYTPLSDDAYDDVQVSTLDLSDLQVIEPQHASDGFDVRVVVTSEETNVTDGEITLDNNISTNTSTFTVDVRAVADVATGLAISAATAVYVDGTEAEGSAPITTSEDGTTITLFEGENVTPTFTANFADNDGSESHYIVVSLPAGWTASALAESGWNQVTDSEGNVAYSIDVSNASDFVTISPDGTVTVSGLTFTPDNTDTDIDTSLQVYAVSYDQDADGDTAVPISVSSINVAIVVDAVADAPTDLSAAVHYPDAYVAAAPGGDLQVAGSVTFPDTDGSEDHYLVLNVPAGWNVGFDLLSKAEIAGNADVNGAQLAGELVPHGNENSAEYFVIKVEVGTDGTATFFRVTETGQVEISSPSDYGLVYNASTGEVSYNVTVEANADAGTQHDALYVKAVTIEADLTGGEPELGNNVDSTYKVVNLVADAVDDVSISGGGQAYEDGISPSDTYTLINGALHGYAVSMVLTDSAAASEHGAAEVISTFTVSGMTGAPGSLYYTVDGGTTYTLIDVGAGVSIPGDAQLYFVPSQSDSDVDVAISIEATVTDPDSGAQATVPATLNVAVDAVADTPVIHLTSEAVESVVTFAGEAASYANVIGVYTVDENGNPSAPEILMISGDGTNVGDVVKTLGDGISDLHFFIVANGGSALSGITGELGFAQVDGKWVVTVDGTALAQNVYFDQAGLNPDNLTHVGITQNPDGSYTVGFEDLAGQGDQDFNDIRVTVDQGVNYKEDVNNAAPHLEVNIGFTADTPDTDGSEDLSSVAVTISGLVNPSDTGVAFGSETLTAGSSLFGSDGTTVIATVTGYTVDGDTITLTLSPADDTVSLDLSDLKVVLPEHSDDDFDVEVSVTTTEADTSGAELTDTNNSATTTTSFHVNVDAVADTPIATSASINGSSSGTPSTTGEADAVRFSTSASFSDVSDGSESHYLLVEVPNNGDASWNTNGMTVTGADGGSYWIVTVTDGEVSGASGELPGNLDYSGLADGTYVMAQVDDQLSGDGDVASITVKLTAPDLDYSGATDESYSARTYAMAVETNTSETEGGTALGNNVAITEGDTLDVVVTDDTPTANVRTITIDEDGLSGGIADSDGIDHVTTSGSLFKFGADASGATVKFGSTESITVNGLDGTITWTTSPDGKTLTGTVGGEAALTLAISGNTVVATLNDNLKHTGDDVTINGIKVIGTDQDGDTATGTVKVIVQDDAPEVDATITAGSSNVGQTQELGTVGGAIELHAGADGLDTLQATIDGVTVTLTQQSGGTYTYSDGAIGSLTVSVNGSGVGTWTLQTPNVAATAAHTISFTATDTDGDTDSTNAMTYVVGDHLPKIEGTDKAISLTLADGSLAKAQDSVVINFGTDISGAKASDVSFADSSGNALHTGSTLTIAGTSGSVTATVKSISADGETVVVKASSGEIITLVLTTTTSGDEVTAKVTAQLTGSDKVFSHLGSGVTISGLSLIGADGGNAADTDSVTVPITVSVVDAVPDIDAPISSELSSNVTFTDEGGHFIPTTIGGTLDLKPGADGLADMSVKITGDDGSIYTYTMLQLGNGYIGIPGESGDLGILTASVNGDGTLTWKLDVYNINTPTGDYDTAYDIAFTVTDKDGDTDTASVHALVVDTSKFGGSGSLHVGVDVDGSFDNVAIVSETTEVGGKINHAGDLTSIEITNMASGQSETIAATPSGQGTYTFSVGGETLTLTISNGGHWTLDTPNVDGTSVPYKIEFNEKQWGLFNVTGTAYVVVVDSDVLVGETDLGLSIAEGGSGAASAAVAFDFGYDVDGAKVAFADASGTPLQPNATLTVTGASGATQLTVDSIATVAGVTTLVGHTATGEQVTLTLSTTTVGDVVTATVTAALSGGDTAFANTGGNVTISGLALLGTDGDGTALADTAIVPVTVTVTDGVPTISATGSDFSMVTEAVGHVTGGLNVDAGADGLAATDGIVATIKDTSGNVVDTVSLTSDGSGGYAGTSAFGNTVTFAGGTWTLTPANVDGAFDEYSISFTVTDADGDTATSDSYTYIVVDGQPTITSVTTSAAVDTSTLASGHQAVSGSIAIVSTDTPESIAVKVNGAAPQTLTKQPDGSYSNNAGLTVNLTQSPGTANWIGNWVMETAAVAAATYTLSFMVTDTDATAGTGNGDTSSWTPAVTDHAPVVTAADPAEVTLSDDGTLTIGGSVSHAGGDGTTSISTDSDGFEIDTSGGVLTIDTHDHLDLTNITYTAADADGDTAKAAAHFIVHTLGDAGADLDYSGDTADSILVGNGSDNMLLGGSGDDHLFGADGNDTLSGGDGNDHLDGGAGNDLLLGGSGDDHLVGGSGDDQLSGGAGTDTFQFTALTDGHDTITDFEVGIDTIDLDALFDALGAASSTVADVKITATDDTAQNFVVTLVDGDGAAVHPEFAIDVHTTATTDEAAIKAQVDTHGS